MVDLVHVDVNLSARELVLTQELCPPGIADRCRQAQADDGGKYAVVRPL
jgi:hypothetical protein